MGFISGIVKSLFKLFLYLGLVVAFIVLIPNLPPYTNFTLIELEPTQPRDGPLAPNDVLNNAQALYKDKLLGPETFQIWNGEIYTGLATGEIVKVSPGGHVTFVTQIGQPCAGLHQEHICGRPLGFVIDEKNKLIYVADAYLGIWKVDLATDKKQLLVSPRVPIDGRVPKIFNSVALDKNGDLYWTDSSSDFSLKDGAFTTFVDPSGRLFHYNSAMNISKVLLDDLWFANGVLISPDNQFVLVAESFGYRILKYYINGPKKGTSEVFVAGLPGVPDVLRALPDGSGALASLYTVFDADSPLLSRTMASAPLARKLLARLARLIEIPFEFLQSQFPNYVFESIVYKIGHFASLSIFTPEQTGVVQMDWNGNIVASYFNTDRSLLHISDVIVYNNKLYTCCPHIQNFIGAVPAPPQLIKAFNANKAKEQPKVESKPTESNKPKVEQKKEVPKNAKPVTQTTPQPTTTSKPATKSSDIPQAKVVKQNTPPKEVKSESAPKESERAKLKVADIKQKEVKKDEPSKSVHKQGEEKPKVAPKETNIKSKVSASQAETKPQVAQKVADPNLKVTPQNTPQLNIEIKNQEAQGKPVKETESKAKTSKTNDVKSEPSKKAPAHSKTSADMPGATATTKAPEPKSDRQNPKTKSASEPKSTKAGAEAGKKSAKRESVPETIPIKENIPSDTAKPNKETLKVIKKSGPQEIPNPIL